MANINVHAISDKNFKVEFSGDGCPVMKINVGGDEINIFFHDGKVDRALLDIDTAIRAFLDNRK